MANPIFAKGETPGETHGEQRMTLPPETSGAEQVQEAPIVFFDGVCGLCNRFVDFILSRDTKGVFRFSPLQGKTYGAQPEGGRSLEQWASLVLREGAVSFTKSDAVIRILEALGHNWSYVKYLRIAPRFLRDGIYDLVARNRYGWFGKREACRLPSEAERDRFLP